VVDLLEAKIKKTTGGFLIAIGAGVAMMGVRGSHGVVVTARATTVIGTIVDTRGAKRSKKSRAWIGLLAKIRRRSRSVASSDYAATGPVKRQLTASLIAAWDRYARVQL
jgi:hypothetical protein